MLRREGWDRPRFEALDGRKRSFRGSLHLEEHKRVCRQRDVDVGNRRIPNHGDLDLVIGSRMGLVWRGLVVIRVAIMVVVVPIVQTHGGNVVVRLMTPYMGFGHQVEGRVNAVDRNSTGEDRGSQETSVVRTRRFLRMRSVHAEFT